MNSMIQKNLFFTFFLFLSLKAHDKDFLASVLMVLAETKGIVVELGTEPLTSRSLHSFLLGKKRGFYSINFSEKEQASFLDLSNGWHRFFVTQNSHDIMNLVEDKKVDVLIINTLPLFYKEIDLDILKKRVKVIISKDRKIFDFLKTFKFWVNVKLCGPALFSSETIELDNLLSL